MTNPYSVSHLIGLLPALAIAALASFTSVAKADTFTDTAFYNGYGFDSTVPAYDLSSGYQPYGYRVGSAFEVDSGSILVTELGAFAGDSKTGPKPAYDSPGYGSNETTDPITGVTTTNLAYTVALYDMTTGTLLADKTINSGGVVDSQGFTYVAIAPLTLASGDTYSITTFAGLAGQDAAYYDPTENPDAPYTPYSRTYAPPDGAPEAGTYGIPLQSGDDITFVGGTDEGVDGNVNSIPAISTNPALYQSIGGNITYTIVPNIPAVPEPADLTYLVLGGGLVFFLIRRRLAA